MTPTSSKEQGMGPTRLATIAAPPSTIPRLAVALVSALLVAAPARASEAAPDPSPHSAEPADLGILDFFTNGWSQDWVHRHRGTRDMALLKVTTNFLERELRMDYAYTSLQGNPSFTGTNFLNTLMAYAVNRRLMLEIIANYQWNVHPGTSPVNGAGGAALLRFQLVDTATASYSVQLRVSAPNKGIGQSQTTFGYYVAGWQDVRAWLPALGRLGLYYSFQYDNLQGPAPTGATRNSISYDVSLACTLTAPTTPVFSDLTAFLELYGTTPLDGNSAGKTVLSLTPGVRFWFVPKNSFTLGAELPVSHSPPWSVIARATYILNF
jgi:hypothetical protein